jgi:signal transduction histidine kinase
LNAPLDVALDRGDEISELGAALTSMRAQLVGEREARVAQQVERERLQQQLREADKLVVVGQLAAAVAHEIGSPLQVLVGWANLLSTDPNASESVHRRATLIGEQAARIARIVGRMQDIVRRRPPNHVHARLGEIARTVVWLLEPEARRRDVRCEVVAADGWVWADADELQQVVLNLTLNGIQWAATRVRVEVRDGSEGAELVVEDDGPGVPEASLPRVFEPLFTTRADQGGTGLGLAVVRWIADRQRAELSVDRSPLGGVRVTVRWSSERAP